MNAANNAKVPKVQLFKQTKGEKVAILMEGNKEDVRAVFLSFYNWRGCVSRELEETGTSHRWYVWTTKKLLTNYFENIIDHRHYLRFGHELEGRKKHFLSDIARRRLEKIPYMEFLPRNDRSYFYV